MSLNKNFKLDPSYISYSSVLTGCLRGFMALAVISCSLGQSCDMQQAVPGLGSTGDEQVLASHPDLPDTQQDEDSNGSVDSSILPVVQTSGDLSVYEGQDVVLDGSSSSDPANKALSFFWDQDGEPPVELHDANTAIARFTAPSVEADTDLTFVLSVSNSHGSSTQTIHVSVLNTQVTADQISISASATEGVAPVTITFSAVAPHQQTLPSGAYSWSFSDGGTAEGIQVDHAFTSGGSFTAALCSTIEANTACSEVTISVSSSADESSKVSGGTGGTTSTTTSGGAGNSHTISGTVRNGTTIVSNVAVIASDGATSGTTDSNGVYQVRVPHNWTGTIAPSAGSYNFTPVARNYTLVKANITGSDFTGGLIVIPNVPPIIVQGATTSITVSQGSSGSLQLSANDSDAAANSLAWSIEAAPHSGSASITSGSPSSSGGFVNVSYTPATSFSGNDSFKVRVDDGKGGAVSITVSTTVTSTGGGGGGGGSGGDVVVSSGALFVDVNNAGASDANPGTQSQPFKTIQKALNVALPGQTVYLRGGTYDLTTSGYINGVLAFKNSGQPGHVISVEGYGSEAVVIRSSGSKAIFDFSTTWGNNTDGFGYYRFAKFKINAGRYGWSFYPLASQTWTTADSVSSLWTNQYHDITIEDVEVDGNGTLETAIYARNAGVRNMTVRRCNFHHTIGTEATVDIGEWKDTHVAHAVPQSASHDLLFEDCDFHHSQHQQSDGIVTQPCVFNVTFNRCRAYNNGKYGFATKSSGGMRLDRCAAWGNDETEMYCRGFGGDSGADRPPFVSSFLLTNCVFIAPANQRGGSALNWRENTDVNAYNCTIVGLRDVTYAQSGGYTFLLGNDHALPCKARIKNCLITGYVNSTAARFFVSNNLPYVRNARYEAGTNLFYAQGITQFKYQGNNWGSLAPWQAYWAAGAPGGDDMLNGPKATNADATSLYGDPLYVKMIPAEAPLGKLWADNFLDNTDVRVKSNSPAITAGENLSGMGVPELMVDYKGDARPSTGKWTIGAYQTPVP